MSRHPRHAAAVATLAGAAIALLAGSAGATTTGAGRPAGLHLVEHDRFFRMFDRPPKGDSAGDVSVFHNADFDLRGRPVGRDQGVCTGVSRSAAECTASFVLRGGTIDVEAAPGAGLRIVAAITGGTGAYAGARGTVTIAPRPSVTTSDITFRFIR
jgi:hypothetical protein